MSLLDRLFERFDFGGPTVRSERPTWAAAQSLADLGELTARWLTGDLTSQPGYYGPVDVDEDDAPGLTDTLVAYNRAGFVTNQSQGACDDTDRYPNAPWSAWVSGFADDATLTRLREALTGTRFGIYAWVPTADRHWWGHPAVGRFPADGPINRRITAAKIHRFYDVCSPAAQAALCDAWQVTAYDPQPGSNDLWPVLAAAMTAKGVAA